MAANLGTGFAEKASKIRKTNGVAVAFFDEQRLRNPEGQVMLENFEYFLTLNRETVKRDFPDIEFRILRRGELVRLPDGTGLNVDTIQPKLGYVLAARGKKRRVLSGLQSDVDFACAAGAFFKRSSPVCPRSALPTSTNSR
jgi:hypothetical protein